MNEKDFNETASAPPATTAPLTAAAGSVLRRPFVEPELLERGDLAAVTGQGAFGNFSP